MTELSKNDPRGCAERLSSKYAAMLFIMPANYLVAAYIFYFIAGVILAAVTGSSELDRSTDFGYTVSFVLNALISYTVPLTAAALLFRSDIREVGRALVGDEGYRRYPLDIVVLYIAGLFFASSGSILTSYVSEWLNALFGIPEPEQAFSGSMPTSIYTFAVITVNSLIVAPVCEEVLYRHYLLKPLRKCGDTVAVIVSAILFSLSHFNFDQMLYTFCLGLFLGIITVRSDSILPALICHIVNNATAVIQSYLPESFGNEDVDAFFDAFSSGVTTAAFIVYYLGVIAAALAVMLKMLRLKNRCELPVRTQLGIIFGNPAFIIGIAVTLGFTVWLLMM